MAYIQKNNPIPRTGCGRRRLSRMKNPFKKDITEKIKSKVKSKAAVKGTTKATKKIGAKTLSKAVRLGGRLTGMVGLGVEGAIAAQKSKAKAYREMDKRSPGTSKRLEAGAYGNQGKVRGTFFGPMKKISGPCKAAAKRKFKVWPSAYASGWGVRCTRAGGPGSMGKSKK